LLASLRVISCVPVPLGRLLSILFARGEPKHPRPTESVRRDCSAGASVPHAACERIDVRVFPRARVCVRAYTNYPPHTHSYTS
jgi:hypothetical protein